MERINSSKSGNPTGNKRPGNDVTKSKACPDIYRDLTDLTSQLQMMSDSLAACRQISKHRPVSRKVHDVRKKEVPSKAMPQSSVQILLPPDERTQEVQTEDEETNVIVSYMMKENRKPRCLGSDSLEKISVKSITEDESECERFCQKLDSESSSKEDVRPRRKTITKPPIKVDPDQLIEIIQRELKVLMDLAPPVAVLVAALSDTLFHYQGCPQCKEKISSSLPWIQNRIQKLIKYVTVKRRGTFCWPSDYECLQFEVIRPIVKKPEETKEDPQPEEPSRQIGKLEKVDAVAVADDRPGVQILLEVNTEKKKKRFFDRSGRKFLGDFRGNFPAVQLKEPASALVVQVLKPSPKPKLLWDNKREVVLPREVSHRVRLVFAHPSKIQTRFRVFVPETRLRKSVESAEEPIYNSRKSLVTVLVPRIEERPFRRVEFQRRGSDEKRPFSPRDFLANAPEIVQDLLREAEEERMQIQKVKELELEVKGLKDLMVDVHKNQMELSKVLLEKGVYSQPIIKLTDPNMLEEESRAVRKVAEMEIPGPRTFPVENLQTTVGDLKRKCILKNRMIMTLLKGLRSDVPKEWWEEIMNSTFDESKPIEEFDSEKVGQFIRQASLFLMNGEKASRLSFPASRTEDLQSEEEPNMKGIVGADVFQDEKKGVTWLSDFDEFLDLQSSMRILAFPAVNVPESVNHSIRLLENQISLLNMENERLWHEVHDLKNLLKGSVKDLQERRITRPASDLQLPNTNKTQKSGKTINLTIQIASEKDFRRASLKVGKPGENGFGGMSKSSPVVRCTNGESPVEKPTDSKEYFQDRKEMKFNRRSDVDLNRLDDLDNRQENEKIKTLLRERAFGTPDWIYSECRLPEVSDGSQAGPSRRRIDLEYLLRNPSIMNQSNERELQPILENDTASPGDPRTVSQAIQRLRLRVRSIHKIVTVLKSKNDRIDKLLDRLLDDAVNNKVHFEEVENDLNNFKNRID